jgi:hypothetical protein
MLDDRQSIRGPANQRRLLLIAGLLLCFLASVGTYFVAYVAMGPKRPDIHGSVRYYRHEWLARIFGPAAALESKLTGEFVNTGWWKKD